MTDGLLGLGIDAALRLVAAKTLEAHHAVDLGESLLRPHFAWVRCERYPDSLAVTDVDDLVEYVRSMTSMVGLKRLDPGVLRARLEAHMDADGVVRIPKEYGLFICEA